MTETTIENPTYLEHVRHFFDDVDLEHMYRRGIDLSTYTKLKARSTDVYFQTRPPQANMPPEADRKWSFERSESFMNWIRNGHPLGVAKSNPLKPVNAGRIRKDARKLDAPENAEELSILKKAFRGIMNLPPDNPKSYFKLAGIHWYPDTQYCKHHEDRYNPWHRVYMIKFEDALRTIPGCEEVTLPYWDITAAPPTFLYQEPFFSYTLPRDIHPNYLAGYSTLRFDGHIISQNVLEEDIPYTISTAMGKSIWEDFISFTGLGIEAAHDAGHGACGITLSKTDAAAFDPLFWFFHANWDRLWWEWQQAMQATSLWKFRSTILGSTTFLEPPFNDLKPFNITADRTIDLSELGVDYEEPVLVGAVPTVSAFENRPSSGSMPAAQSIAVEPSPRVSVRLKGIDRLIIPGSFKAILTADGKAISRRTFFQSSDPASCESCRKNSMINLDFIIDLKAIIGKELGASIELIDSDDGIGSIFPLHAAGNPTLNIRMLLGETQRE